MPKIAHISDLHFGATDPRALRALVSALNAKQSDILVATGDITQSGREREYLEAAAWFGQIRSAVLVVPGNHDAPVFSPWLRLTDPWRRFRRILRAATSAVVDIPGARIVALNSARRAAPHLDWSKGRLSRREIAEASRSLRDAARPLLRIVALHHPIVPGKGRVGEAVVGRAREAISAFADAGVDLVLTGHVHISEAKIVRAATPSLVAVMAGTACSSRLRGEAPAFHYIEGDDRAARVSTYTLNEEGYSMGIVHSFVRRSEGWATEAAI